MQKNDVRPRKFRAALMLRWAVGLSLGCCSMCASASSTRGLVVSMTPVPGTTHCELVVADELAGRELFFLAQKEVCGQRAKWEGRRAVFHLSLVDVGGRLEAVATRVGPWPPAKD